MPIGLDTEPSDSPSPQAVHGPTLLIRMASPAAKASGLNMIKPPQGGYLRNGVSRGACFSRLDDPQPGRFIAGRACYAGCLRLKLSIREPLAWERGRG